MGYGEGGKNLILKFDTVTKKLIKKRICQKQRIMKNFLKVDNDTVSWKVKGQSVDKKEYVSAMVNFAESSKDGVPFG